ncbi:MAG TPA: hypothetical protein V6C72_07060 [Chroococcales cyanobacterium]
MAIGLQLLQASGAACFGAPTQYGEVNTSEQQTFRLSRTLLDDNSRAQSSPPSASMYGAENSDAVMPPLGQRFPNIPSDVSLPTGAHSAIPGSLSASFNPGRHRLLTGEAGTDAINPTCDLSLAAEQAQHFPASPEAAFVLAVALTKTTHVEEALAEVRRARTLARGTGDPNYFDRAVGEYEQILKVDPGNNCIRYGLAWAYYMQAYLYAEQARKAEKQQADPFGLQHTNKTRTNLIAGAELLASALSGTRPAEGAVPHIPGALENVPSWAVPQIHLYYQKCLQMFNSLLANNPRDVWASVYRVHVQEEYDGDHQKAMNGLVQIKTAYPDNPAASFFLADAEARGGHYAAGLKNLTRALQLRAQGQ